jgi:hypothetical protein
MTFYELEVAAYAAAHKIYTGLPTPDRACPGGYRSAVIDQIAEAIKQAFSVHFSLASSESSPSPEVESVRHSEFLPQPWAFFDYANAEMPPGLQQTRHWRTLRHAFDMGGGDGTPDRPCLKCAMPHRFAMHFSPSWKPLQPAHVEPTASDEATIPGEANP